MFYIVVVQAVLLYGSETWILNPHIERMIGGFHHRVVCRLAGRMPQRNLYRTWTYPYLEEAM